MRSAQGAGGPADEGGPLDTIVPADPARLSSVRAQLTEWLARTGMSDDDVGMVVLAAYEALANAVEHAYPDGNGQVRLQASRSPGATVITVADSGHWQPPAANPGNRGRGLPLMRSLAHHVDVRPTEHGTTVELHWVHQPAEDDAHRNPAFRQSR